jgi:hypothetical protein
VLATLGWEAYFNTRQYPKSVHPDIQRIPHPAAPYLSRLAGLGSQPISTRLGINTNYTKPTAEDRTHQRPSITPTFWYKICMNMTPWASGPSCPLPPSNTFAPCALHRLVSSRNVTDGLGPSWTTPSMAPMRLASSKHPLKLCNLAPPCSGFYNGSSIVILCMARPCSPKLTWPMAITASRSTPLPPWLLPSSSPRTSRATRPSSLYH